VLDDVITKSEGKLLFIGNPNQDLESPVLFFKQNAQVDELKCLDINAFLLNFYLMYPPKTQTQSTRANREIHSVLHKFSNFNGNYKEVIDTLQRTVEGRAIVDSPQLVMIQNMVLN
jgi:hypothetical protein